MNEEGRTELLAALARVVEVFDALGVDYLVGGWIASSIFGEPRQTLDADLLARMFTRQAAPLVEGLSTEFYADLPSIVVAIRSQGSFNLIHLETMTKVDVFVRGQTAFGQSQMARRQKKQLGQGTALELFFASPEDTVLSKLDWYRKGGELSECQWREMLGVLKVHALPRSGSCCTKRKGRLLPILLGEKLIGINRRAVKGKAQRKPERRKQVAARDR